MYYVILNTGILLDS